SGFIARSSAAFAARCGRPERDMATILIVAPVFALIALGYIAVRAGFVSEGANKGISEFAFSIAIPALLFRTVVISEFPEVSAVEVWSAFYGALALTWI